MADSGAEEDIGWGKPPKHSQFATGHRRSPKKRRKRQPKPLPYEAVFGQLVSRTDPDGTVREITLEQAVLEHLKNLAMRGLATAHEHLIRAATEIKKRVPGAGARNIDYVQIIGGLHAPTVNAVILGLDIAVKLDPDGADPIILIRPWAVEEALRRLDRQLSVEEQRVVWEATLTPRKVRWPDWWTERRGTGKPRRKRPLIEDGAYPPCIMDDDEDEDEGRGIAA